MTNMTIIKDGKVITRDSKYNVKKILKKEAAVVLWNNSLATYTSPDITEISQLLVGEIHFEVRSISVNLILMSQYEVGSVKNHIYKVLTSMPGDNLYPSLRKLMKFYGMNVAKIEKDIKGGE